MDLDRGHKLQCYEELPTVQHIVLAYADRKRVEHHRRTESGWERKVLSTSESVGVLDAVEFRIDLARIYFDVLLFGMQFLALPSRPIIVSAECLSNQAPGVTVGSRWGVKRHADSQSDDISEALDDMLFAGGKLNVKLLGGAQEMVDR
jgi:hypothetical protein